MLIPVFHETIYTATRKLCRSQLLTGANSEKSMLTPPRRRSSPCTPWDHWSDELLPCTRWDNFHSRTRWYSMNHSREVSEQKWVRHLLLFIYVYVEGPSSLQTSKPTWEHDLGMSDLNTKCRDGAKGRMQIFSGCWLGWVKGLVCPKGQDACTKYSNT